MSLVISAIIGAGWLTLVVAAAPMILAGGHLGAQAAATLLTYEPGSSLLVAFTIRITAFLLAIGGLFLGIAVVALAALIWNRVSHRALDRP